MKTDLELLAQFHTEGSGDAFGEIVRRHINVVYAAARRRLGGDATLADEVTQQVFIALAQQARRGRSVSHVVAWLHGTTRQVAAHAVRSEQRRREREFKAHEMQSLDQNAAEPSLPPGMIDGLLDELPEADREAVVLRFFEEKSFAEIGEVLRTSEDATRMRVNRALERMQKSLARKGVTSTATALGAALAQEVLGAPTGLTATVQAAALAAPVAPAGAALTGWLLTKWIAAAGGLGVLAGVIWFSSQTVPTPTPQSSGPPAAVSTVADSPRSTRQIATQAKTDSPTAARPEPPAGVRAKPSAPPATSITKDADAERMARIRPWLAAGQPLTGYISLQVGDTPRDVPVSLVMGEETRLDAGDGNAIYLKPELNDNGSVLFNFRVHSVDPSGQHARDTEMKVISTPWGEFSIMTGPGSDGYPGGQIIAFDPDQDQFEP
ncbi:MAG TPA: sigma-70 family RNA polymerase sigma factor [Candidatus Didemnitutus sp.]|nr:sigma-70 family RNA polymerase sigma factor [Candidatus Didemnitutus sp.]